MDEPPQEHALLALRQATRELHERVEEALKLDATVTMPRYIAILQVFHSFLQGWETQVREALPDRLHAWFDARRRSVLAGRDLEFLAVRPLGPAQLPAKAVTMFPLPDTASVWGSMYVMEGSALGGLVIAPRLAQTLGVRAREGGDYFHGFGERTGAMWREFRGLLARELGSDPNLIAAATAAANATFGALLRRFEALDGTR